MAPTITDVDVDAATDGGEMEPDGAGLYHLGRHPNDPDESAFRQLLLRKHWKISQP